MYLSPLFHARLDLPPHMRSPPALPHHQPVSRPHFRHAARRHLAAAALDEQPHRLRLLQEDLPLCALRLEGDQQQRPRLDFAAADGERARAAAGVGGEHAVARNNLLEVLCAPIGEKDVRVHRPGVDAKGPRRDELALDGLTVDEGEQLGGRADERAFTLPEQAGEIERHSVTDPSRLRDESWTHPGRGRRVGLERLEDSSLDRRDHADGYPLRLATRSGARSAGLLSLRPLGARDGARLPQRLPLRVFGRREHERICSKLESEREPRNVAGGERRGRQPRRGGVTD
mmetsp:Transcript_35278/g.110874  ORF Transcript_35278/g.110874 Transcript_35278/m.110874 type:complete len:287 (-) Transcript_35278:448-1308(-)